ncbi:beta-N-acetylhexosaminidase [Alteromonas lipolytica]|uniref:Beta-hexosaminidase n=1 Tax=Alteromonas lipolytica TaxID=1856405 RepID=A0A1E8FKE4_9ALTE|nr:beta-N-acetylhexosaminidase [Alteromonas lipolytica]OFI36419.1 beta-N-acetylhexosaminidase [Alteromonas lipolytica]GGF70048.1 beta-hexosaminidase [Alteromonas lipolytica]
MGPVMIDCRAVSLQQDERDMLAHPLTGGVILFTRNYESPAQLTQLIQDIRAAAGKPLVIAVDHEGGRVQRFREGFTRLPAMGRISALTASDDEAQALSYACGVIMAYELKQLDIDISFAPVLDINGVSNVIGDRGFDPEPAVVIRLAGSLIDGMHAIGMPATGKHFPGHGSVVADSHIDTPVDERDLKTIEQHDLKPFVDLIKQQKIDAMMPAHVRFAAIDDKPAGFSRYWLQTILRGKLGFDGVIFSDDLSMEGAAVAGGYPERAKQALDAGCDMVLACNNTAGAAQILTGLPADIVPSQRLQRLVGQPLKKDAASVYTRACELLQQFTG